MERHGHGPTEGERVGERERERAWHCDVNSFSAARDGDNEIKRGKTVMDDRGNDMANSLYNLFNFTTLQLNLLIFHALIHMSHDSHLVSRYPRVKKRQQRG